MEQCSTDHRQRVAAAPVAWSSVMRSRLVLHSADSYALIDIETHHQYPELFEGQVHGPAQSGGSVIAVSASGDSKRKMGMTLKKWLESKPNCQTKSAGITPGPLPTGYDGFRQY